MCLLRQRDQLLDTTKTPNTGGTGARLMEADAEPERVAGASAVVAQHLERADGVLRQLVVRPRVPRGQLAVRAASLPAQAVTLYDELRIV